MTIREIIIEKELVSMEQRHQKLIDIDAPTIMVVSVENMIKELCRGNIDVGGDKKLLDLSTESYEVKTGRGGKLYIEFDNGVLYFPHARYGRYVTLGK